MKALKIAALSAIYLLGMLTIIASGGGGGGNDPQPAPEPPATLNANISVTQTQYSEFKVGQSTVTIEAELARSVSYTNFNFEWQVKYPSSRIEKYAGIGLAGKKKVITLHEAGDVDIELKITDDKSNKFDFKTSIVVNEFSKAVLVPNLKVDDNLHQQVTASFDASGSYATKDKDGEYPVNQNPTIKDYQLNIYFNDAVIDTLNNQTGRFNHLLANEGEYKLVLTLTANDDTKAKLEKIVPVKAVADIEPQINYNVGAVVCNNGCQPASGEEANKYVPGRGVYIYYFAKSGYHVGHSDFSTVALDIHYEFTTPNGKVTKDVNIDNTHQYWNNPSIFYADIPQNATGSIKISAKVTNANNKSAILEKEVALEGGTVETEIVLKSGQFLIERFSKVGVGTGNGNFAYTAEEHRQQIIDTSKFTCQDYMGYKELELVETIKEDPFSTNTFASGDKFRFVLSCNLEQKCQNYTGATLAGNASAFDVFDNYLTSKSVTFNWDSARRDISALGLCQDLYKNWPITTNPQCRGVMKSDGSTSSCDGVKPAQENVMLCCASTADY